jgi:hypothetical protein
VKPREASVIDHCDGEPSTWPAVQELSHCRFQIEIIDTPVRVRRLFAFVVSGGRCPHHLLLSSPD